MKPIRIEDLEADIERRKALLGLSGTIMCCPIQVSCVPKRSERSLKLFGSPRQNVV
jgi:hypothetical protein